MKLRQFADSWGILFLVSIVYGWQNQILFYETIYTLFNICSAGAKSFSNARFGRGSGPSLLDWLRCSGTEQNLLNCSHRGEGVTASYCRHYDDAGVRCLGTQTSMQLCELNTSIVSNVFCFCIHQLPLPQTTALRAVSVFYLGLPQEVEQFTVV